MIKHLMSAIVAFTLSGAALAQDAIRIAPDGSVEIPGTLTAGSIKAKNLDEATGWTVFADTVGAALDRYGANPDSYGAYEFVLVRGTRMDQVVFSKWSATPGWRMATLPQLGGGHPMRDSDVGGSLWVSSGDFSYDDGNTSTTVNFSCPSGTVGMLYFYGSVDLRDVSGVGVCKPVGQVIARARRINP